MCVSNPEGETRTGRQRKDEVSGQERPGAGGVGDWSDLVGAQLLKGATPGQPVWPPRAPSDCGSGLPDERDSNTGTSCFCSGLCTPEPAWSQRPSLTSAHLPLPHAHTTQQGTCPPTPPLLPPPIHVPGSSSRIPLGHRAPQRALSPFPPSSQELRVSKPHRPHSGSSAVTRRPMGWGSSGKGLGGA